MELECLVRYKKHPARGKRTRACRQISQGGSGQVPGIDQLLADLREVAYASCGQGDPMGQRRGPDHCIRSGHRPGQLFASPEQIAISVDCFAGDGLVRCLRGLVGRSHRRLQRACGYIGCRGTGDGVLGNHVLTTR